ncbi:hypothetical protein [Bacteroides intestinalis]|uniref:Uncharacterized protein n=1 Tax=Bacteroides intestinalis TaxID=329854 RepID=A0A139KM46_9BACE|nr:hypothetical protein [Bacteroides intestinalis]KXT40268.1 hypothetical protein HMPREF2531_05607 [Bacteroides intestinalis]
MNQLHRYTLFFCFVVLFFGAPEIISGTPKQLAARLKAREGLHSEVVAPESEKTEAKKQK